MITFFKNQKGLLKTETQDKNGWINVVCKTKKENFFLLKEL